MDIARPDFKRKQSRRKTLYLVSSLVCLAALGLAVAHLKPAVPTVQRSTVWTDAVKRGALTIQVHGPGLLTPREDRIRLIPADTEATVVRIRVLPGANVKANTILMDLANPELQQELLDAHLQLKAARVESQNLSASLQSDRMTQREGAATVSADYDQAHKQAQTDKALYDLGVISGLTYSASQGKADELSTRNAIEKQRLTVNMKATAAQLEVQQTKVEQAEALLALKEKQVDALSVSAGIDGVLINLPHQVGEHITPGAILAEVVQPDQLKATLRISETDAQDIRIGQAAEIDTHNGIVDGTVARIDPAVRNGTVSVDVTLTGSLPQGARPDLSVDGTIDLDRLQNVLYVGRPAIATQDSTISLFKLGADGTYATRVSVAVGQVSVNSIQVLSGLQEGDTVILSDMSRDDGVNRVRME